MINFHNTDNMTQPTLKTLNKEYVKIKRMQHVKPLSIIAARHQYNREALRAMMKGKVKTWKPIHFTMYNELINFKINLVDNQQVSKKD